MTPEQTFKALQWIAREQGRAVQELLTLYVLERFVAEVRSRMETRLWLRLGCDVTAAQRAKLDELLVTAEGSRYSRLDQLRKGPVSVSAPALVRALIRVENVRSLGIVVANDKLSHAADL